MLLSVFPLSTTPISVGPPRMIVDQRVTFIWNIYREVERLNFRLKWGIQNPVGASDLTVRWDLQGVLVNPIRISWNIVREVVPIRHCRIYKPPCEIRIASCTVANCRSPDVTRAVSNAITFLWEIPIIPPANSLTMQWAVVIPIFTIEQSLTLLWDNGAESLCLTPLDDYDLDLNFTNRRYTWCIDWAPDGLTFITGHAIDRIIETRMNGTGTPYYFNDIKTTGTRGYTNPDYPGNNNQRNTCLGIQYLPDGSGYIATHYQGTGGVICEWSMTSPYYMSNTGEGTSGQPTLVKSVSMDGVPGTASRRLNNFRIAPNGQDVLGALSDSEGSLAQYYMSTPWDINTMTFVKKDSQFNHQSKLHVSPGGTCIYSRSGNKVRRFALASPWEAAIVGGIQDERDMSPEIPVSGPGDTERIDCIDINDDIMTLFPGNYTGDCGGIYSSCVFTYKIP